MRLFKKILLACTFAGSLGWAVNALAADSLPDTKMGGTATRSAADAMKRDAVCTRCHDESEPKPILSIYQTRHGVRADARTPTCQSCHGESEKHLKGDPNVKGRAAPDRIYKNGTYQASSAAVRSEACLSCHQSGLRMHWSGSQHESRDVACNSCHAVHTKKDPILVKTTQEEVCFTCHKTQRAETHKISTHPLDAGKMSCSDCHNPHGSTGPKLLAKNTVNETCYTCHAEKRGPFLWEHAPVQDDCTNCHTPHGSTSTPLLKARLPWLCQQCHSGDHAKSSYSGNNLISGVSVTTLGQQQPGGLSPTSQLAGKQCLNCHSVIHGSNHPAGAKFHR